MGWTESGQNTQALTNYEHYSDVLPGASAWLVARFQDGPIAEHGVNGTTNEEVIEMLLERLTSLNEMEDRKYACRENSLAITHLEEALMWLQRRTAKRQARGVEGRNIP